MVRLYEKIFYMAFAWQTKLMKEKEIPIIATIFTISGEIVFWLIAFYVFLIKSKIIEKNFDNKNLLGYFIITLILIFNFYYFNKQKVVNRILSENKNLEKNPIAKTLYVLFFCIPFVYILIYIWCK